MTTDTLEAPPTVAVITGPIGPLIDKLDGLREEKRALETKVKLVEAKYKELEEGLLFRMQAEGADKVTGKKATASISSSVSGTIEDWEAFTKYVAKTKYFHLFQRRLSDPAVRELFETKGKVPGLGTFVKRRLNLRSL